MYQSELAMASLKYNKYLLDIIVFLLVLLWVYTATSKLMDIAGFKEQLYNQAFSRTIAQILLWLIPSTELTAAILLLFAKTRLAGILLSFFLMSLFTGYIVLVLAGYYDRVPCSCGGVLKILGWTAHLWFNSFFLFISGLSIPLYKKIKINSKKYN